MQVHVRLAVFNLLQQYLVGDIGLYSSDYIKVQEFQVIIWRSDYWNKVGRQFCVLSKSKFYWNGQDIRKISGKSINVNRKIRKVKNSDNFWEFIYFFHCIFSRAIIFVIPQGQDRKIYEAGSRHTQIFRWLCKCVKNSFGHFWRLYLYRSREKFQGQFGFT